MKNTFRTPKNKRSELEQSFRNKAAKAFFQSRKETEDYARGMYFGQYISEKFAALSVQVYHRHNLLLK